MIPQQDNKFFVFATEKHIGIQMLPADGNPYKYLGLTGHPSKVISNSEIMIGHQYKNTYSNITR